MYEANGQYLIFGDLYVADMEKGVISFTKKVEEALVFPNPQDQADALNNMYGLVETAKAVKAQQEVAAQEARLKLIIKNEGVAGVLDLISRATRAQHYFAQVDVHVMNEGGWKKITWDYVSTD